MQGWGGGAYQALVQGWSIPGFCAGVEHTRLLCRGGAYQALVQGWGGGAYQALVQGWSIPGSCAGVGGWSIPGSCAGVGGWSIPGSCAGVEHTRLLCRGGAYQAVVSLPLYLIHKYTFHLPHNQQMWMSVLLIFSSATEMQHATTLSEVFTAVVMRDTLGMDPPAQVWICYTYLWLYRSMELVIMVHVHCKCMQLANTKCIGSVVHPQICKDLPTLQCELPIAE